MIVFAAIAALLSLVALHDAIRQPSIRRVALRNLSRRIGEASLVVFGSALGTAIIAGAFIVGDTFDNSIRDIARTDLGPIDNVVSFDDPTDLQTGLMALATPPIDGVDGVAAITGIRAAVATPEEAGQSRKAVPTARVNTADFDALRKLGLESSGLAEAGPTPTGDQLVIDTTTADELGVSPGDAVEVYAYGDARRFVVRRIVDHIGIAGYGEVFIADEAFFGLVDLESEVAEPPVARVLVSQDGGVFDSTDDPALNRQIENTITTRLDEVGLSYNQFDQKADLLADAEEEGAEITEIFTAVGGFSVLAGVLLLVNLFVMLAEERKTSLGVLRAIGWRRGHLVRSFVLEGAAYGLAAAVVGALVGIPVGWVIVRASERLFAGTDSGLDLQLAIEPRSLLLAGLVGLVISLMVSWVTSARISRLNIIRAIRDIPEPNNGQRRRLALIAGAVGVAVGAFLTIVPGIGGASPALLILGAPLALASAVPLLSRLLPGRAAPVLVGIAIIAWAVGVFSMFPDVMQDPPISVFLFQGVLMVGGAVAVSSSLGAWWARMVGRVPGGAGPSTQLGLAYPTARRFRTGVSLAMFSLIVFSLTFIAVLSTAFDSQIDVFTGEASNGYDALVLSNPANPVAADALLAAAEVDEVATILQGGARFSSPFDPQSVADPRGWRVSGINADFTALGGSPDLIEFDPSYADPAAVFAAVATDPTLIVVPTWFLDGDGPSIGDSVTLWNQSEEAADVTIVGLIENDWIGSGVFLSSDLVSSHLPGEFSPRRHYISFADDSFSGAAELAAGAAAMNGRFVENGVETETFIEIVGTEVREQQGFFNLLSGYLSLGLLIGVAGLGVVMIRAVRERRAQVGMLRAMGMATRNIRSMFLTEGGFVALQGVLSGVLLGLLSSYQLLVRSNTFEIKLDFVVPWLALAIIALLPLSAAALASAIPARRAARIPVAAALRLSD
ncbi:MAG: FtsX-like permease family protein [Acidimicrobiales bacterium]